MYYRFIGFQGGEWDHTAILHLRMACIRYMHRYVTLPDCEILPIKTSGRSFELGP